MAAAHAATVRFTGSKFHRPQEEAVVKTRTDKRKWTRAAFTERASRPAKALRRAAEAAPSVVARAVPGSLASATPPEKRARDSASGISGAGGSGAASALRFAVNDGTKGSPGGKGDVDVDRILAGYQPGRELKGMRNKLQSTTIDREVQELQAEIE
eukprot:1518567-Prorocentrum_lima.AAC.1